MQLTNILIMKKFTLLSGIAIVGGLLAISTQSSAQISIGQTDLPYAGLSVTTDSAGAGILVPGAPSASTQAWDFSTLTNVTAHTINFMDVSATPYASVFTAATLADSTVGGNGYNFFDITSGNFAVVGAEENEYVAAAGVNFKIELALSPLFNQSVLPATYGATEAPQVAKGLDQFAVTFSVVVSGERFTTTISYSDTVDAWGTMKMPGGKTYDVLRQKHHEYDIDSVYIDEFGTWAYFEKIAYNKNQYDWYTNGVGYILAEMDMDSTFTTPSDVIWDASAPAPLGVNNISVKNAVNVYPSPANAEITFSTSNTTEQYISIYDVRGKQIERVVVKNGMESVNTTAYSNGIYLYNITDNSGNLLNSGKFVVQH